MTGFCKLLCSPVGLLGRAVDHNCAFIERNDQIPERFDRIVNRIRNRTGDIFRHGCFYRQIAVRQTPKLIQKANDRRLIALRLLRLKRYRSAHVR